MAFLLYKMCRLFNINNIKKINIKIILHFALLCIQISVFLGSSFFFISCVSPASFEDYAIAHIAIKTAKESNAGSHSTNLYLKALSYYRQGEISFKNKDYGMAKEYFEKSREMAERAELITYLKKSMGSGGLY